MGAEDGCDEGAEGCVGGELHGGIVCCRFEDKGRRRGREGVRKTDGLLFNLKPMTAVMMLNHLISIWML